MNQLGLGYEVGLQLYDVMGRLTCGVNIVDERLTQARIPSNKRMRKMETLRKNILKCAN